jgi:hypothetical protein
VGPLWGLVAVPLLAPAMRQQGGERKNRIAACHPACPTLQNAPCAGLEEYILINHGEPWNWGWHLE